MSRVSRWAIGLALPIGLATGCGFLSYSLLPTVAAQTAPAGQGPKLPIRKVVLFSSGVGFFQREGEVDGDARINLTFPVGEVNDLLKSLTVQDLGGGRVQAVGYDSHDPVERTLKSFAINLSDHPGQGAILSQVRGEKVEVTMAGAAPAVTGTIVGVERRDQVNKDEKSQVEFLNLLTAEGMRSIKLLEISRVRFLNPTIEGEFRRALETLALSHDTQKKAVGLQFTGAGRRPVRVSYVTENPVWKTSYRMVLDKNGKPFLQGWAVVENTSDEDWNDVRMALVSGRPISFRMDLYSPLYVPRPMVEPELFASLRPPTYDGPMSRIARADEAGRPMSGGLPTADARKSGLANAPGQAGPRGQLNRAGTPEREVMLGTVMANPADAAGEDASKIDLSRGVASAASGAQLGDYFQYTIEDPINVARQKSAMLPIVNKEIDGTRVSIYNQRTHPKYPLLGLRFKNATGMNLMQGPVTVFDGTSYAGDARLPDLQAGEERLISYAIDLGTEVEMQTKVPPTLFSTIKIVKGVLHATRKIREEKTYKAANRSKTDRVLLVEHPFRPEYQLAKDSAKPNERTRDVYRFELKVAGGGSATADVIEERDLLQMVELLNANEQQITLYLRQPTISPAVKAALEEAILLRGKLTTAQRDVQSVARTLAEIAKEQERLRANLKELPPTSAAYKRTVEKFDQQETQIEKLQSEQKRLQEQESQARQKLEQFVQQLVVE